MAFRSISLRNKNKKKRIISEINVTPFVDVLLVLLIIFMITAPMMTSGVDINLPEGAVNPLGEKIEPFSVLINKDGEISFRDTKVKLSSLSSEMLKFGNNQLDNKVYVKADKSLDYGRVMEVVKVISLAGFHQVVLVTELAK